jgi:hypothetical protein
MTLAIGDEIRESSALAEKFVYDFPTKINHDADGFCIGSTAILKMLGLDYVGQWTEWCAWPSRPALGGKSG